MQSAVGTGRVGVRTVPSGLMNLQQLERSAAAGRPAGPSVGRPDGPADTLAPRCHRPHPTYPASMALVPGYTPYVGTACINFHAVEHTHGLVCKIGPVLAPGGPA